MNPLPVLFLFCIVLLFSSADEEPAVVFVLLRTASIELPSNQVNELSERIYYRGRSYLAEENARLAYLQGQEFHKRYPKLGIIDKRYIPKQVRIASSESNIHHSTALYFGAGLFEDTRDGTPIIPLVNTVQIIAESTVNNSQFENLLQEENSPECNPFSSSLIAAAVVELENPESKCSPRLKRCVDSAGRRAYFKAQLHQFKSIPSELTASFIDLVSKKVEECLENATKCGETEKFEAIVLDGPSLIAFSNAFSALSEWKEQPPAPCSAFVVELKIGERRIEVYFKRDITAQFEIIRRYTWEEWDGLKYGRNPGRIVGLVKESSQSGKTFLDREFIERIVAIAITFFIITLYICL